MAVKEYSVSTDDIEKLEQYLEDTLKNIDNFSKKAVEEVAKTGLEYAKENYNSLQHQPSSTMDFFIEDINDTSKKVVMEGTQAIYSEFGTGTIGEQNPHPDKGKYGLNPYNSGKTIRPASFVDSIVGNIPEGELFWTYVDENGITNYTQGVPAGKQMYNANTKLREEVPSIIEKVIDETMENFGK